MLTARRRWLDAVESGLARPGDTAFDDGCPTTPAAHHHQPGRTGRSRASAAAPTPRRHRTGTPIETTPTRTITTTAAFASLSIGPAPAKPAVIISDLAAAGGPAGEPATCAPQWRIVLGNLAAGATAGAAVEAALYPIDTIKTRLQLMRSGGGLRALLQAGGGRALYTGVWGNLAGVMPASAIFMGVYEPIKRRVADQAPPGREWLGPLIAGATAGVAASVVRVPTEVVKQRMQSGEFGGAAIGAVRAIVAREGVRGMFAGYGSFLLRDIPFDAIEFVAYEQLKRAYAATLPGGREVNAAEVSAIGATAGAITGVVTTPLDVLKTRLMTQGASGRYKGIVDCTTKIVQEEGVGTLFRGWEPRVLWIGLGGCVFFSALEQAKRAYAPKAEDWPPPAAASSRGKK